MNQSLVTIICDTIGKKGYSDCLAFRNVMLQIRFRTLSHDEIEKLKTIYHEYNDQYCRNQILIAFIFQSDESLKGFFRKAFYTEKQLSYKLIAIRGYAQYVTEDEIIPLMEHFVKKFDDMGELSPYDYEQFEVMRSEFCMPYLVSQYGYDCFLNVQKTIDAHYAQMPEAYKGLFMQDQFGQYLPLLTDQELSARFRMMMRDQIKQDRI